MKTSSADVRPIGKLFLLRMKGSHRRPRLPYRARTALRGRSEDVEPRRGAASEHGRARLAALRRIETRGFAGHDGNLIFRGAWRKRLARHMRSAFSVWRRAQLGAGALITVTVHAIPPLRVGDAERRRCRG